MKYFLKKIKENIFLTTLIITFITLLSNLGADKIFGLIDMYLNSKHHMIFTVCFLSLIILLLLIILYKNRNDLVASLKLEIETDGLTQITNRDGFNQKIDKILKNKEKRIAIAILDLDYFKDINDFMGHDVGDHYLIAISNEIKLVLGEGDFVARLGGDEFIVVIQDFKSIFSLRKKLKEIHGSIKKTHYLMNEKRISGSASIGVSLFTGTESKDILMKNADLAMYAAKKRGKNQFAFFNNKIRKQQERVNLIKNELKLAIINKSFEIHYQPIINKKTSKISGLEALLRWKHETLGNISPSEFIPIAEKYNLIYEVGDFVLNEISKKVRDWSDKGIFNSYLSFNVSPKQLIKSNFAKNVIKVLNENGVPPNKIQIEVTETTLIKNIDKARDVINELKESGIRVALDDFGDGYSSLSYLVNLNFDAIKLDKSFVDDIGSNPNKISIIKNVCNIVRDIGADFIIEGLETKEQIKHIKDIDFTHMQGYFSGMPRNNKTIEYYLLKESKNLDD